MDGRRLSASRVVRARPSEVFALLAHPDRHAEIDGSDMVRGGVTTEPISRVGQVFRMDVHHPDAGDYRTDNHVSAFEDGRRIAWRTAAVDTPPEGWEWRWDLEPVDETRTRVTVTYDWSAVTDPAVLELVTFPVVPVEALERTLANLAEAVEDDDSP